MTLNMVDLSRAGIIPPQNHRDLVECARVALVELETKKPSGTTTALSRLCSMLSASSDRLSAVGWSKGLNPDIENSMWLHWASIVGFKTAFSSENGKSGPPKTHVELHQFMDLYRHALDIVGEFLEFFEQIADTHIEDAKALCLAICGKPATP